MKKMKKLAAIVLSAVMVMALAVPAFAATSSTDTGSVTINGLNGGTSVSAYRIAKATYDSDGNFLGYEMTVAGEFDFTIGPDGSYDEEALTEANLAALWAALGDAEAAGTASISQGQTSVTIPNLPVGSYLIVITGSESVAYGMMIGSVSYDVDPNSGDWAVKYGSIAVEDCELWAKATTPTIEKTEHHDGGNDTHGESGNVGDEITFDITVANIPSYQGAYPEFDVADVMTGLTISDEELAALTVKVVDAGGDAIATLVKDTDYTVEKTSDHEFDVNFVVNGSYTLNNYANKGYKIVIEYQATIDDTATYEGSEHDNDATLNYSTTSYEQGNDGKSEDKDYEYTFALNAQKTDGTSALRGATFGLFTDSACSTVYEQEGQAVTAVSDGAGNISFSGLAEGTYYMKETKAPAGYLLNEAVYTVTISADYNADGTLNTWSITIRDESGEQVAFATQSAETGLTIINTRAGLLPSMGGRGTLLFTVIGCAIVAGAAVGIVTYRKRRAA